MLIVKPVKIGSIAGYTSIIWYIPFGVLGKGRRMAVLLPLAMLLLGKTLSKTKQHKAVCFAVRSLPSLLHGADDTCKFSAPPREQKSRGALELQCWQAVGTHLPPSLASGEMLGWKLHPRASSAHIKALSHVTDLGHIFKR